MSREHGQSAEFDAPVPMGAAYLTSDDAGFLFDCPACHFWKNNAPGPCRRIGCGGTVVRREFRVTPPERTD